MKTEILSISPGNDKIVGIPSISITPVLSCVYHYTVPAFVNRIPCAKTCYAKGLYDFRPNVRKAWDKNYRILMNDENSYFDQLQSWLVKNKPRFFRYHVAGDIVNQRYLGTMVRLAKTFPRIDFTVYTKNYYIDYSNIPGNLHVFLSAWPCLPIDNKYNLPIAWMFDVKNLDVRIDKKAFICKETCDSCKFCYRKNSKNRGVIFPVHGKGIKKMKRETIKEVLANL